MLVITATDETWQKSSIVCCHDAAKHNYININETKLNITLLLHKCYW